MRVGRRRAVRIMAGAALATIAAGFLLSAPRRNALEAAPGGLMRVSLPFGSPSPLQDPAPGPQPTEPNPLPPAAEPPQRADERPMPVLPSPSSPPAGEVAVAPAATSARVEDPEAAARAFVERARREADESVQALAKEAESLRARLHKVEAGLARWQAVKEALEANGQNPRQAWKSRGEGDGDGPDVLDPLRPADIPGEARPNEGPAVPPPARPSRLKPVSPRRGPDDGASPPPASGRSPFDREPAPSHLEPAPAPSRPARPSAISPKPAGPGGPPTPEGPST